jgi:hypothetical protein
LLTVASPAAISAVDRGDDQASALVVAQGVDARPGADCLAPKIGLPRMSCSRVVLGPGWDPGLGS